jgi:uncharacterized membrane protein
MTKGLRWFGHPLHAVLSDFPVALLGTSLLWDALGLWRGAAVWWAISFWDIALGLVIALAAAGAGAVDYAAINEGEQVVKLATTHMMLMLLATGMYVASLLVRGGPLPPAGVNRIIVLSLESLGLILLMAGGWCGGHLVFHHGVGRDRAGEK